MNLKNIISVIAILGLVAIIVILLFFNISSKQKKSGFTELYFTSDLPKTINTGEQYTFSFAIRNLEDKKMIYNCIVYFNESKLSQDYVFLDPGQTTVINQSFILGNVSQNLSAVNISVPISVQLLNKRQEIHFWALLK